VEAIPTTNNGWEEVEAIATTKNGQRRSKCHQYHFCEHKKVVSTNYNVYIERREHGAFYSVSKEIQMITLSVRSIVERTYQAMFWN